MRWPCFWNCLHSTAASCSSTTLHSGRKWGTWTDCWRKVVKLSPAMPDCAFVFFSAFVWTLTAFRPLSFAWPASGWSGSRSLGLCWRICYNYFWVDDDAPACRNWSCSYLTQWIWAGAESRICSSIGRLGLNCRAAGSRSWSPCRCLACWLQWMHLLSTSSAALFGLLLGA